MELKLDETRSDDIVTLNVTEERNKEIGRIIVDLLSEAAAAISLAKINGEEKQVINRQLIMRKVVEKCETVEEVALACYSLHPMIQRVEGLIDAGEYMKDYAIIFKI